MNHRMIARLTGYILLIELAAMLPSFLISLFKGETASANAFLITMGLLILSGGGSFC